MKVESGRPPPHFANVDLARDRQHHHDEREQREDDIRRDAERVGVDLRLDHVLRQRGGLRPEPALRRTTGRTSLDGNRLRAREDLPYPVVCIVR
jgi:hypothetical protein